MNKKQDRPVSLAPIAADDAIRGVLAIDPAAWDRYKKELGKKKAKAKRKKKGR